MKDKVRRSWSEVKQLWVDALRSGKYVQGRDFLNKDNKFCCLGVLCDIVKEDFGLQWEAHSLLEPTKLSIGGSCSNVPLPITAVYLRLNDLSARFDNAGYPLWRLNDKLELSFIEIADLIEAQF